MTRATVWLTGLPGAGKTTLARALENQLQKAGRHVCVIDGDELRAGLSSDLSFSRADRGEQVRRAAHVATLVAASDAVAIVALVSPYSADRLAARAIHRQLDIPFFEVWVNTPADVCEARDPKGLYSCARAGCMSGLTGRDAPYEPPHAPECVVSGCEGAPEHTAARLARLLEPGRRL